MGLGDRTLHDRLKQCREQDLPGIPEDELLAYMEDAARAIDYLNSPLHDLGSGPTGIQHCDIKPRNIMIVGGATQVCDFGLAQMLGADRTTTAAASLAYAAPECLQDGRPSQSTDQYSLAVSYYELKTGKLPYREETHVAVMNAKFQGTLDFSEVPPAEQAVLRRATSNDPDARYSSTAELVEELRRAVRGEEPPVTSTGGSVMGRCVKTAVLLAILGLAAYAGWWLWPRTDVVEVPEDDGQKIEKGDGGRLPPDESRSDPVAKLMAQAAGHEQQGEFRLAVDGYTQAIRIEPEKAQAYVGRGRCYLQLQEYATAISDFEQAKNLDPAQFGTHEDFAGAYLARGTQFLQDGMADEAIADFTQAAAHNPRDGRIYSRRGTARFMLNEFREAEEDFTTAIQIDHHDSDYVRRGRVLQAMGHFDQAIADFQEAARLNPQNGEAHYYRGDCCLEIGENDQAISAFSEAIRIGAEIENPGFDLADAYGVRGLCRMVAEQFEEAAADLTQAIRLGGGDLASLHESRAACHEMLGRVEPAGFDRWIMGCFRRIEADPQDYEAHNELAYLLATSRDPETRHGTRAIEHATRACELTNWQEALYLDTLAAAYAEAGQFDEAVRWAEKAVELAADEEAAKAYAAALELYRQQKPSRFSLEELRD
jgi:tetratricopeptide (TPR) repeat protein